MAYVVFKHPAIRIDLMINKKYWAEFASIVQRMDCTYDHEEQAEDSEWVNVVDIQAHQGYKLGELIGLFYGMEWSALTEGDRNQKFYILLNPKRRAKKNVQKNRQKAGTGSQGGDQGGAAHNIQSGQDLGPGGSGDWAGSISPDDLRRIGIEPETGNLDCD